MAEPTITCPNCRSEIKLTESLAAPLIQATRAEFEKRLAQKDAEFSRREETLRAREQSLAEAKESLDEQVAEKLKLERAKIAADEARKAKLAFSNEVERKAKEVADLQEVLKQRDEKLADAQKAQAELMRKQRELDDARREMELNIETRVQQSLAAAREQARKEAEEKLAATVREKDTAIAGMQKQIGDLASREQAIKDQQAALAQEKESLEQQLALKLSEERTRIAVEEAKKAKLAIGADLEQKNRELVDLQEVLKQREEKLAEAQQAKAELIRKSRELDDAKREMDLTIETRIQQSLAATREQAKKEAEEQLSLKVIERDQTIASLQKNVDELKRKIEQGSQQLQGEAMELQLESVLAAKFPHDLIEPVPKGEHGGDILQRIVNPTGTRCGTIIWESKRTKNWSDGWLPKLREDQRAAKAEIAILVSAALPKGVETFDQLDGVWVVHPRAIIPVALSLRQMLIEVNCARQASDGQHSKMELIYHYLTGPRFRLRVQAIVEAFTDMKEDLQKERKAITKYWAKREEQIERVMQSTVGMYGDLQGIAGKTLQEIEGLEFPALPEEDAALINRAALTN